MQIISKWMDGMRLMAIDEASHNVVMEGSTVEGRVRRDPSPMETLLMGVAGCSSTGMVVIVEERRQNIISCQAAMTAKHAEEPPRAFTEIHVHLTVTGRGLKVGAVEQAVRLSAEKYCFTSTMSGKTTKITHSFEIVET